LASIGKRQPDVFITDVAGECDNATAANHHTTALTTSTTQTNNGWRAGFGHSGDCLL
jgi:hypothetical protein